MGKHLNLTKEEVLRALTQARSVEGAAQLLGCQSYQVTYALKKYELKLKELGLTINGHSRLDIVGHRFGKLTVLKDSGQRRAGYILWECQCECGRKVYRTTDQLTYKRFNSGVPQCESCRTQSVAQRFNKDKSGQIINDLKILRQLPKRTSNGTVIYECECLNCHKIIPVKSCLLSSNSISQLSCGCSRQTKGERLIQE
jgi:hypothetical protein